MDEQRLGDYSGAPIGQDKDDLDVHVVVVGGGVAGLTAAHELIIRGFRVTLIESAVGTGRWGKKSMKLGGMARSQYYKAMEFSAPEGRGVAQLVDVLLPGEHGFRFFPSYYHHIWDTLQRIPILEGKAVTGRTVYDNVLPCLSQGWVGSECGPVVLSRRPPDDLTGLIWTVQHALKMNATLPDLEVATMRVLRYMCTSSGRREAECEDLSALGWFTGGGAGASTQRFCYSKAFEANLEAMPVVLAAFNAAWGDARTNLNNFVQLVAPMLREQPKVDGVLNGPTTEAWLNPWQLHLKNEGVEFVHGKVEALTLQDGELKVSYTCCTGEGALDSIVEVQTCDYIVLATDAPAAEALSKALPKVGVPKALDGFTTSVPPNPLTGGGGVPKRDPYRQVGLKPWDRFQTLTGIQYFFKRPLKLLRGHLYFMGSEWALTGLTQQPFWRDRPDLPHKHFSSVLSVDVGAWHAKSSVTGKSASESTLRELADEVWRQIASSLTDGHDDQLPEPFYFLVDDFIKYDEETGLPCENRTPYFIPMVCDFKRRPGAEPWNPTSAAKGRLEPAEEGVWQAEHGGQLIHWGKLVYAGAYLKTFTRLTSMEAACESGRHAVNAILDHVLFQKCGDKRAWPGIKWRTPPGFVDGQNDTPIAQPTRLGDYCVIWNMEDEEPPQFRYARDIDAALFKVGLPHPWELLGIDRLTEVTSWLNKLDSSAFGGIPKDPAAAMRGLALGGLQSLTAAVRVQNDLLSGWLKDRRR